MGNCVNLIPHANNFKMQRFLLAGRAGPVAFFIQAGAIGKASDG